VIDNVDVDGAEVVFSEGGRFWKSGLLRQECSDRRFSSPNVARLMWKRLNIVEPENCTAASTAVAG
jgi:hypothetical protein